MAALSTSARRRDRRTSNKVFLPAAPLADIIMKRAEREGLGVLCARIGIPERVVMRWRRGEANGQIEISDADLVMTRLGLFWWEIWTEETVREPLFVVTTYYTARKKHKGVYRRQRIKHLTIPYGDLGTDFWRLREIRKLMSGGLEEAA